ncbi:putative polysaccharide intercellular adhesin synthesis protein [Niallia circulans]|uniref:acyltransferase family protein n=1 Tax=Shouchella clausii TaxID=79880 RepID=UPI000BA7ACF9|nr:acyltransferase family protein [Shouchella clausii]PAD44030.1 hypothetical protein CHH54_04140 [Bacillus sp. 7520-S]PAE98480.1 hypothetical protein CHH71_03955 [Shouchella clausii]PAF13761.1 hypothetical protein CHH59_11990 [Shouchella clausii]SPT78315.1 putative polysaccharide intercellular adhesin synthesis protein [Niallia circulans]
MSLTSKDRLFELDTIRALACLSIVMLHSIKQSLGYNTYGDNLFDFIFLTIATLLAAGTPLFVFLNAFLLAYKYDTIPLDFYKKRFKLLLIPFICMALFYAIYPNISDIKNIPSAFLKNLVGDYHGWFILVILQFYFLYHFFIKFLYNMSAKVILICSAIITASYLSIFNFIDPPTLIPYSEYIWNKGYWILFPGWLLYFSLAFCIGSTYDKTLKKIKASGFLIFILLAISTAIVIFNNAFELFNNGSKRIDMVFFSSALIVTALYFFGRMKKVSSFLQLISRYSFSIYLIHMFFLDLFYIFIDRTGVTLGYFDIIWTFVLSVSFSMIIAFVINKPRFGKYVVGNVNRLRKVQQAH